MTAKKPEPVLITMSVLAGLQILFGGVGSVTFFADHELVAAICAVGMVAVGAVQAGVMYYVRGQVVPLENVVERVDENGVVRAGPANNIVEEGTPVRNVNDPPVVEALIAAQDNPDAYLGDHGAAGPA